jgi:hypothetical protein
VDANRRKPRPRAYVAARPSCPPASRALRADRWCWPITRPRGGFAARCCGADAARKAGHRVTCRNSRDAPLTESGETPDLVCAFGGDGTARTLVDAGDTPPCVYPAGTINLLARGGYPADPDAFAARLGAGEAKRGAFRRIGEEPFLCCASVGPDAEAVAGVSGGAEGAHRAAGRRRGGPAPDPPLAAPRLHLTVDGVASRARRCLHARAAITPVQRVIDEEARLESDHFRVLIRRARAARHDPAGAGGD